MSAQQALHLAAKCLSSLQENINQQALCQVGAWAIGEFGDLLVNANVEEVPVQVYPMRLSHRSNYHFAIRQQRMKCLISCTVFSFRPPQVGFDVFSLALFLFLQCCLAHPPICIYCYHEAEHSLLLKQRSHPHPGTFHMCFQ